MSNDWGFGGNDGVEKKKALPGAFLNSVVFFVGVVLVLLYGLYKIINPTVENFSDGLNIAAHVSLVLGIVTLLVAAFRIRALNRKRNRGF